MSNNFIQSTKNFFNKKPVRIILALIIIASIMTGIGFAIVAIVKALNPPPKCPKGQTTDKTYNTCLEDACANKEDDYCNSESGGNIKGGVLDPSGFPSCGTCKCPDGKVLNSKKTECIDKCGKTGKGCDDGNVCAFFDNTSTDVTNDNLECYNPSSYNKCEKQINNYDVYCDLTSFDCKNNYDDSASYCSQSSPQPAPSGHSCADENSGYACMTDNDCNSDRSTKNKCNKIYNNNDWRKQAKIGICDNTSTVDTYGLGCISQKTALKSLTLNQNNVPTLCNDTTNPCKYEPNGTTPGNSCNTGCCSSTVCKGINGYCPANDYKCLNDGSLCKSENVYDNNSSCCSNKAVNNECLTICDYSPFNGKENQKCKSQTDCDNLYNTNEDSSSYLGKAYKNFKETPTEIKALCIKNNPQDENGICKLACGNEDITKQPKDKIYSCGSADNFSFCNAKGLCSFSSAKDFTPANGTFNYDRNSYEKIICNYSSATKHWKAKDNTTQYSRNFIQQLEPSAYINPEHICTNTNVFNQKMKDAQKYNYANVTDIKYCSPGSKSGDCGRFKSENDYLYITQGCNYANDVGPIYSDSENFENVESTPTTKPYPWNTGSVLQKPNISPLWNEFGYYNDDNGTMNCVSGINITKNCKYLQNSLFCDNGSFDGSTCLNFDPTTTTGYSSKNLCKINKKPSSGSKSLYGNNFICTMPSGDNQNKQYKCLISGTATNGFGMNSCCGMGFVKDNTDNSPVCDCSNNVKNSSTDPKCDVYSSTPLIQANNFKYIVTGSGVKFFDIDEGNKIPIIGNLQNYIIKTTSYSIIKPHPRNYLVILQEVKTQKYLNVNTNITENTKLVLTDDSAKLGVFFRQTPDNVWKYSIAGNIYTCLTYYDYLLQKTSTDTNHFGKFLNGVNGSKNAIVSRSSQMNNTDSVKPIIIIPLDNGDFALGATTIQFQGGMIDTIYAQADGRPGKMYIGSINKSNNTDIEFNNYVVSGTNDPDLIKNIRGISNVAIFKCPLLLDGGRVDDKFLASNSTIQTIEDLIERQFNIGKYKEQKHEKTINELLNMFSKAL